MKLMQNILTPLIKRNYFGYILPIINNNATETAISSFSINNKIIV